MELKRQVEPAFYEFLGACVMAADQHPFMVAASEMEVAEQSEIYRIDEQVVDSSRPRIVTMAVAAEVHVVIAVRAPGRPAPQATGLSRRLAT